LTWMVATFGAASPGRPIANKRRSVNIPTTPLQRFTANPPALRHVTFRPSRNSSRGKARPE
jgi:hypothetical protein